MVVSEHNALYIGDQWEQCFLTLATRERNAPYIGGQWQECPLTDSQKRLLVSVATYLIGIANSLWKH